MRSRAPLILGRSVNFPVIVGRYFVADWVIWRRLTVLVTLTQRLSLQTFFYPHVARRSNPMWVPNVLVWVCVCVCVCACEYDICLWCISIICTSMCMLCITVSAGAQVCACVYGCPCVLCMCIGMWCTFACVCTFIYKSVICLMHVYVVYARMWTFICIMRMCLCVYVCV